MYPADTHRQHIHAHTKYKFRISFRLFESDFLITAERIHPKDEIRQQYFLEAHENAI